MEKGIEQRLIHVHPLLFFRAMTKKLFMKQAVVAKVIPLNGKFVDRIGQALGLTRI